MTPEEFPHCQAAFINAISEEGTKEEAVRWLQKTWNEVCWLRKNQKQAIREAVEEERKAIAKFIETHTVAYAEAKIVENARDTSASQATLATAVRARGKQDE